MSNNSFASTGFTVTNAFTQLSELLTAAGINTTADGAVTGQSGYIKNNSTTVNLLVGVGASSPTYYASVEPYSAIFFNAGMNTNEVWLKSASSTVAADFVEGASNYIPPNINGVVGSITATEGQVPKADSGGNLVASSISDDGSTVTVDEDFEVTGVTTLDDALSVGNDTTITGGLDVSSTGIFGDAITANGGIVLDVITRPITNDGVALGDATHNFSDLFLASGALLNFANGNSVVTHSSAILTVSTGDLRVTTAGTNAASVVTVGGSQVLTSKGLTTPTINGGAAMGATSTEIDQLNDVSAYQQSLVATGALSTTKVYSGLAIVAGGAVTLAAPDASMLGQLKTIERTIVAGTPITLGLTNVVGGSAATTATFTNIGETLVLLAAATKWIVVKEFGVVLS